MAATNGEAMAFARSGAAHGTVVVADRQTAGRGRQARMWLRQAESIFLFIIERQIFTFPSASGCLSPTGLGHRVAVRTVTGTPLALKWPNDLLLNEKKVGGILCENGTDRDKQPSS